MTNEKITAMPVKKTQIHLTATLSLPLRLHERAWICLLYTSDAADE